jgi:hypothetical protein
MNATPLPPISLRDLARVNEASTSRTPGLHVTDIIQIILRKIDPSRYGGNMAEKYTQETRENWQEAGFLWEELLSKLFAERLREGTEGGIVRFRPGELRVDGILLSPDAAVFGLDPIPGCDPDAPVLEEYKATYKSSKDFDLYDKRYIGWLLQMQAYCHALGTNRARLYVWHVNGDYKGGRLPEVAGFELSWTRQELAQQWASLLNTARKEGMIA